MRRMAPLVTAAGDDSAELATKLQNPVANLISVSPKLDWDTGIDRAGGPIDWPLRKNWPG